MTKTQTSSSLEFCLTAAFGSLSFGCTEENMKDALGDTVNGIPRFWRDLETLISSSGESDLR